MLPAEKSYHSLVDPLRFRQILANLISNAIRYLDPKESIIISIQPTETTIEIAVSDSGPGISEEDKHQIFERFYRADKSRNKSTGGSGLGLAIAKGLAEAHDGSLLLLDKEPPGATFVLTLPRQ
jgi:two-component system sensor histidine kinase BaeS